MPRPPKWKSPTTAIRVPAHLAESLLEVARSLECAVPGSQSDPEQEAYLNFVQNSTKPHLVTICDGSNGFRERSYLVKADPLSVEQWRQVEAESGKLFSLIEGLSEQGQLYVFSRLVQEVFPEHEA